MQNHHNEHGSAEGSYDQDAILHQLCISVLPLWADQIDAAKTLTNQSIEELSQKFSSLSLSIRNVTSHGQSQSTEQLISLLNESQSQLGTVISLLKNSIDEKKSLLQAVSTLSANAKDLKNMADIVTRIAKETGMVAVNAAIEAARVGDRGRGFAVVAEAVRRLSSDAAKTGSHISETVATVSTAIHNVTNVSKEVERKDAQTLQEAEQIVKNVVDQFGSTANEVVNNAQEMLQESLHVGQEIDQVLYSLQFQDRVSQMLTHVQQDVSKLSERVADHNVLEGADEWLEALRATYTMREQSQIHDKKSSRYGKPVRRPAVAKTPPPAAADDGEITFF